MKFISFGSNFRKEQKKKKKKETERYIFQLVLM